MAAIACESLHAELGHDFCGRPLYRFAVYDRRNGDDGNVAACSASRMPGTARIGSMLR